MPLNVTTRTGQRVHFAGDEAKLRALTGGPGSTLVYVGAYDSKQDAERVARELSRGPRGRYSITQRNVKARRFHVPVWVVLVWELAA